jgi:hypothetical protein
MKPCGRLCGFKPQERFRSRFQRRLTEYRSSTASTAEGFGLIWEQTLEEVPLDDDAQGQLYREMINWARSDELFTAPGSERLMEARRETVHEF